MTLIRHFRQRLLWPLQLMPREGDRRAQPWSTLLDGAGADGHPWREAAEMHRTAFHERHYNEFVTFLPYVQRFLYGDGQAGAGSARTGGGSSMRVLRREDVAAVRLRGVAAAWCMGRA